MPYIDQDSRFKLLAEGRSASNSGELAFEVYSLIVNYIKDNGACWQTYSDIIGAVEGSKLEAYRRIVAPHEDIKIKENGDIE